MGKGVGAPKGAMIDSITISPSISSFQMSEASAQKTFSSQGRPDLFEKHLSKTNAKGRGRREIKKQIKAVAYQEKTGSFFCEKKSGGGNFLHICEYFANVQESRAIFAASIA
jgi:hypothetical protein